MPFGKHAGEDVADVPLLYLWWLIKNVRLFGKLRSEVEKQLGILPVAAPPGMSVQERAAVVGNVDD